MVLPRPPRAVVFDMDGTLVDTEKLYHEGLLAVAKTLGCPMEPDFPSRTIGMTWPDTQAFIHAAYAGHDVDTHRLLTCWREHVRELRATRLELKPGVLELLDLLDARNVPAAVATASSFDGVAHSLGTTGVIDRFRAIVAFGDYARVKPAPDPFLVAADRLGVDPADCLALEDSVQGVRSAASAGMMTVMVPDLVAPDEELRALCLHVARDLHEVRDMLVACLG